MHDVNYFKLFKQWLIYLGIFDVIVFLFIFISGRTSGDIPFANGVTILLFAVVISSTVIGVTNIVYSIYKKAYIHSLKGAGILLLTFILGLMILVIALSEIW